MRSLRDLATAAEVLVPFRGRPVAALGRGEERRLGPLRSACARARKGGQGQDVEDRHHLVREQCFGCSVES